jgi:hypothetical protein
MSFRSLRPAAVGLLAVAAIALSGCGGEKSSESGAPPSEAPPSDAGAGFPATTPPPIPAPGGDPRAEFAAIQQHLNGLQQQAMQDSVIQSEYAALEAMVEGKMAVADPELAEHRGRLASLQGEMGAAQQAGEDDKLRELLEEGTALQGLLRQVQQDTMAREDVQAAMVAFRDKVLAKMTAIDPEAPKLVERADSLRAQLTAAPMGVPGGPGAGDADVSGEGAGGDGGDGAPEETGD